MSLTNSYRRAFHGTSKAALASILEKGLIPAANPGADAWAAVVKDKHFDRRRVIFLSRVPGVAATFSQFAAQVRTNAIGQKLVAGGVVLEVDLSAADPKDIEADHAFQLFADDTEQAFMYRGEIPPSWIKSYCEVTPTAAELPSSLTVEYMDEPDLKLGPAVPVKEAA